MPDKVLHSFNGPYDNGKSVDWSGTFISDNSCDDILKFSTGLTDFRIKAGIVVGGKEDAVDVNNKCRNLEISADKWIFKDRYSKIGFTIKGGSESIRLGAGELVYGDPIIDLGNASDQSHDITRGIHINLKSADGRPLRVRVLGAERPTFEPGSGPYRYIFPWSWVPFCHLVARIFLAIRRLPVLRNMGTIKQQR